MNKKLFSFLLLIVSCSLLQAQTSLTHLIRQEGDKGSYPFQYIALNDVLLFTAATQTTSREIWVTDGSAAGAVLLKDLAPGPYDGIKNSFIEASVKLDGNLYFAANDLNTGEIWKTDGTSAGTERVTDFLNHDIETLTRVGNQIFFFIDRDDHWQLWKSDGTATGTVVVKDDFSRELALSYQTSVNGKFIFAMHILGSDRSTLWESDGTEVGTSALTGELVALGPDWGFHELTHFVQYNQELYWVCESDSVFGVAQNVGIMKTDGTLQGTVPVTSLFSNRVDYDMDFGDVVEVDGRLYFSFFEKQYGAMTIWETDGTFNGTKAIYDVRTNQYFMPSNLLEKDNKLIFTGFNSPSGSALLSFSPPSSDLVTIKELARSIAIPARVSDENVCWLRDVNASQIMVSIPQLDPQSQGRKVWFSDLTSSGTVQNTAFDGVSFFTPFKGNMYFPQLAELVDWELWRADLQDLQPALYQNINTSGYGMYRSPKVIYAQKNNVYFPHEEIPFAGEVWKYNRVNGKTQKIEEAFEDAVSTYIDFSPGKSIAFNEDIFFVARDRIHGYELWKTDGLDVDIMPELVPENLSSSPSALTVFNNNLYYLAQDEDGDLLARSDGNEVTVVKHFQEPNNFYPRPEDLKVAKNKIFVFLTGFGKDFLWVSDGRSDGTYYIDEFISIKESAVVGDRLFFVAQPSSSSPEGLWISNGKLNQSELVKNIGSSNAVSIKDLTPLGDKLIFSAMTDEAGQELWISDGTEAGTFMLKDIFPGPSSSANFLGMKASGDHVFFIADDGVTGRELWCTDGTSAGTFLVQDINPGADRSFIRGMAAVDGNIYFQAHDGEHGAELWFAEPQPEGARLIADLLPGSLGSDPQLMVPLGQQLYFIAETETEGRQLFQVPIEGREPEFPLVDDLVIFPNPASDFMYVVNPVKPFEVFDYGIYDMLGRKIREETGVSNNKILLKEIQTGNYILRLTANGESYSKKFSKY